MVDRRLHEVKVREDVGSKRLFELPACDVANVILWMLFRGIVDKDVETAKSLNCAYDHLFADFFVADVARQKEALAAFLFDLALGFFGVFVFVKVADGNVRAFFGEEYRDGAANAAVATGDESDFAAKFSRSTILAALSERTRPHFGFATGLTALFLRRPDFSFLAGFRHIFGIFVVMPTARSAVPTRFATCRVRGE
jgi:hypothetical protein